METSGSVIVSWDFSNGKDRDILLVGRKRPDGAVEVINAFQGVKARELYLKLTMRLDGKYDAKPKERF